MDGHIIDMGLSSNYVMTNHFSPKRNQKEERVVPRNLKFGVTVFTPTL